MKKRFNYLVFLLAVILSLGLAACNDDKTRVKDTGDTIENDSSVAFSGKVVDILGNPLSGVKVQLTSDKKQSASTDKYGNWLIVVDLGKVVATPGGGSGDLDDDYTLGSSSDRIVRSFPIEISKSRYATYRYEADFSAQIGYTDGTGAVVLLSKTGTVQPTVVMHPYVDNFSFTVYAGANTAPGAVVTLFRTTGVEETDTFTPGINQGSIPGSRYEVTQKRFVADANGVINVTADDLLPADGFYNVFAAPYDADGDGVYEYDASITTQPSGGFNLHAHDVTGTFPAAETTGGGTGSLLHYEYDALEEDFVLTQTEFAPTVLLQDAQSDLVVVYCSIQNVQNIPIAQATDFNIQVMFNRPVTNPIEDETLAINGPLFTLTGLNGNIAIPYSTSITDGYLYVITPDEIIEGEPPLTPQNNSYRFEILSLFSVSGDLIFSGLSQLFNIYDPSATMLTAITPGIDINTNLSYKVDWNAILLGDPSVTNPFTTSGMIPTIDLSWACVDLDGDGIQDADVTGYEVWVKDSDTPWQQVGVTYTYNDGQFIEATINLGGSGGLFDAFDPDDTFGLTAIEPFFGGNVVQIVVMPTNINGFATDPSTDPLIAGLSLSDNWGPSIVQDPPPGWDGSITGFQDANTNYDILNMVIAVDEPLQNVILVPEYTTGQYGARASSGYFRVADVRWPDLDLAIEEGVTEEPYPSNRGYILVDLEPTLTTTLTADALVGDTVIEVASLTGFALNDNLIVGTGAAGPINGFDVTAGTLYLFGGLSADSAIDTQVYWNGPIQNGYNDVNDFLNQPTNTNDWFLFVDDPAGIASGQARVTTPTGVGNVITLNAPQGFGSMTINRLIVANPPGAAYTSGATISGYNWRDAAGDTGGISNDTFDSDTIAYDVTTVAIGAAGLVTVTINDTGDLAVGDVVTIARDVTGEEESVSVATVVNATQFTCTTTIAHLVNRNIEERGTFSTTATFGYPTIPLPLLADGIQPNSLITFADTTETDTATVIGAYTAVPNLGTGVVINDILEDSTSTRYTFAVGSTFVNDSSRVQDTLQVNLLDRSGNDSSATDADNDGDADGDEIGYEIVDDTFNVF